MVMLAGMAKLGMKTMIKRLAVVLAMAAPRLLLTVMRPVETTPLLSSKMQGSKVSLRDAAKRFRSCLSGGDVNVEEYVRATNMFAQSVESMGDWTTRGVSDARQNLRRVEQARGRLSSMRALLMDQVSRGARKPEGGPASRSGAEALQWSRLGIAFWVETFKSHLRSRKTSLADATRNGFQRTIGRYLDRFGRAAFNMASRATPDWDVVRQHTSLGCEKGVCSDEKLTAELRSFVEDVEPVLQRMTELQKSAGLEDLRTP